MVTKNFIWPALLAGVVGIPYIASRDQSAPQWEMQPELQSGYTQSQYLPPASYLPAASSPFIMASTYSNQSDHVDLHGRGTIVLPADVNAPDLNAMPLAFLPAANFGEVIRLDANSSWVKSRWDRISVFPAGDGLTAFRCDLITGVNQGDLRRR